jgi:hypothetical protein
VDIARRYYPPFDTAILTAQRRSIRQVPPEFAVIAPQSLFNGKFIAGFERAAPGRIGLTAVIRMDDRKPYQPPGTLCRNPNIHVPADWHNRLRGTVSAPHDMRYRIQKRL